jgi:hypothetical protein
MNGNQNGVKGTQSVLSNSSIRSDLTNERKLNSTLEKREIQITKIKI